MSDHLRDIIERMKQEFPDNVFVLFVESLEENHYGTSENQDYLKKLYPDVVQFYKEREKRENED